MLDFFVYLQGLDILLLKIVISIVTAAYLSWIYFLLFFDLVKKEHPGHTQPISVIIPCYNEPPETLIPCIESIARAKGEKEIILVNNNSNCKRCLSAVKDYSKSTHVYVVHEDRQGKRFAHSAGLKKAKHEIVVFVDSDTILHKNALLELGKYFKDPEVGGVTGQIRVQNKDTNLITRAIDAMFWSSCNIFRRASAKVGFMQVMPGALSSYRKKYLLELEDEYINQKFLGRGCSISDDRYLTMRMQTRFGKKIVFDDKAIAYTEMPSTIWGFWKTMVRWRRGMIREIILLWKEPKKKAKLMFLDTQFNFIIFNLVLILRLILIYNLIFNFSFMLVGAIFLWIGIMTLIWNGYMLIKEPLLIFPRLLYSVLYEFIWNLTYFDALLKIRDQGKWVTR